MRTWRSCASMLVCLAMWVVAGGAWGQAGGWPDKPIRVIVPFTAGGPSDVLVRLLAPKMADVLGQPLVVENKPGASANLGTEQVARAAGDGHTLLFAATYITVNPSLFRNLRYDVTKDLVPVALADLKPMVLVASPTFKADTLDAVVTAARASGASIHFASPGSGTLPHLAGELLNVSAGIRLVHVPYKGIPPAQTDVLNGNVQLMFNAVSAALPMIRAGKLRAIVVPQKQRHPLLPEVPTAAEAGMPRLDLVAWDGFFAPAGTPEPVLARIHAAVRAALDDPVIAQRMTAQGMVIARDSREAFAARVRDELALWADVVRASGARAD